MWVRIYIIMLFLMLPLWCFAHEANHILYINSYSPNFPTYAKIDKVLQDYQKKSNNQIEIQFLYAKKYNSSDYIPILKERFKYILSKSKKIDLILTSDDFAFNFVLSMQDSLFKDIPVVFLGVNNKQLALNQNNNKLVTGVIEDVSMYETIKHAIELDPEMKEIIAISDDMESGLQDKKKFLAVADSFPNIIFSEMEFGLYRFDRFLNEISKVSGSKAFLLLSGFVDVEGQNYTFDYSLKKIVENSKIPVYHLWEHGLGDGIAGGKLISHEKQAEVALSLVDSIFKGYSPGNIKVVEQSPNKLIYDLAVLKKFKLYLANLSTHAELINTDKEFFFVSKNVFYIVTILLVILIIGGFIIAYNRQINKKLAYEVSEATERYESIFKTSFSCMLLIDPETGDIADANKAACEYYGYTYDEITQMNISNINILSEEQIAKVINKAFVDERNQFEFKHRLSNGEIRDVESFAGKITNRGKPYLYSIIHDITQRKRAEQELVNSKAIISENEQKYRNLFDNTPIGIIYMDLEGVIIDINNSLVKMIASPDKENSIGQNILMQQEIKRLSLNKYFEQCVRDRINVEVEFPYLSRFNKDLYLKTYLSPVFDKDDVIGVQAAVEDISEKNKAEVMIRQSEAQFRLLAENVPGVIYLCDNDDLYTMKYLNEEIEKLTGYSKEKFLTGELGFANLIHPEDQDHVRNSINSALSRKEAFRVEYRIQNKDKKYKWVEENGVGLFEDDSLIWLEGFILDISSRKFAEEELTKIAKIESLSVLASGIAHNFKNMLASINLSVDLARRKPENLHIYADRIEKTVDQANAIARRFQTFSSGGEPIREVASICNVLDESLSIALSGTNVQIVQNYKPDIWNVEIDTKQMTEVFTNLFINAKQAMETKSGKIYVDVNNHKLSSKYSNLENQDFVETIIRDEGDGIPEEILEKIFDPFFTTKDDGHGLGLATVSLIIKKHKGIIKVNSKINFGTEFKIYLPATKNVKIKNVKKVKTNINKNSYRILIMDDDENIRLGMKEILELSGHIVVDTNKGEIALLEYQKSMMNRQMFDVVILDLTIVGGMQGEETLNKLLLLNPSIKAIVCSAHSSKPIMANYREYGFSGRISKPLNYEAILAEIDRVVNIKV